MSRTRYLAALCAVAITVGCAKDRSKKNETPDPTETEKNATTPPPEGTPTDDSGVPRLSEPNTPAPPPGFKVTNEGLVVWGSPRTFTLVVPETYSAEKSYPLVMVLHGDGGNGTGMHASFPFEIASEQNAIIVYPTGQNGFWNLYKPIAENPDDAMLDQLVTDLRGRFNIGGVYATGFSSGAFMINQLACRRGDFFRAIAPHSGGAPSEPEDPNATKWENGFVRCAGQGNVAPATMVVHGTVDPVVTYDSGEFTARYWAYVNGCATTENGVGPCMSYDGCPAEKPVVMCSIPDLGHGVWVDAMKSVWGFFAAR